MAVALLAGCSGDDSETGGTVDAPNDTSSDGGASDVAADSGGDARDTATTDSASDSLADTIVDGDASDSSTTDAADAIDTPTTDVEVGPGTATVTGFAAFGDCMPIVPPDPINASWTVNVTGATGATATLASAKLTVGTFSQNLTVDHPDVALTGGAGSQAQRKTSGDATPPGCGTLCASSSASLDLSFVTAGGLLTAHAEGTFGCAF